MKKIYILFILALLLISCKTKQPVPQIVYQEKIDTVHIEKIKTINVPTYLTQTIEKPCDSAGLLKQFKQTIKAKGVEVVVQTVGQSIVSTVNTDSLKQVWEREYQTSQEVQIKEVPVEVPQPYVPKWIKILAGLGALFILYILARIASITFVIRIHTNTGNTILNAIRK